MKTNMIRIGCITVALSSLVFAGCKKDTPSPASSGGNSQYNMYMTDAPGSYQQVNVNIINAEVNSSVSGWMALTIHPGIYNLLTLTNGKDTLLASGSVPAGAVTQVRLTLGDGNTVMANGTIYPLQTPSAEQSGLKLNVNQTLVAGSTYNLTLDFDAGMSVVQTGNGSYILKPVIRAVMAPDNGGIKGIILPVGQVSAVIAVSVSSDSTSTYSSGTTGNFLISVLPTGSYKLIIIPPAPYSTQVLSSIQVQSGYITNVGGINLQ